MDYFVSKCRKLIGAKYFYKGAGTPTPPEIASARDVAGHGTHTSSTAVGQQVPNANFEGLANGTATGGAPSARLAMYKVCWGESCAEADLLAGFEAAISDGVDLISLSVGAGPVDYSTDVIAIGSYHAVEKGIIVSCAAGNNGPDTSTAANTAPWIFTVAANTINRLYESNLVFPSTNRTFQVTHPSLIVKKNENRE
jgi:subtilisin family serine protease